MTLLWGDDGDKQRSNAAHVILSANVVTRSKAKSAVSTPRDEASPLARWTERTLIDPKTSPHSPTANYAPIEPGRPIDDMAVSVFTLQRQAISRFVRDALRSAVDKQKKNADKHGRKYMSKLVKGNRVLLSTEVLRDSAVTNTGARKLAPRFIGPFKVLMVIGYAYTLDIHTSLRLHPTFYVGRLKQYRPDTLHGSAPMTELGARMSASPPVFLKVPVTSDVAAFPYVHAHEPGVPGYSSF